MKLRNIFSRKKDKAVVFDEAMADKGRVILELMFEAIEGYKDTLKHNPTTITMNRETHDQMMMYMWGKPYRKCKRVFNLDIIIYNCPKDCFYIDEKITP